ncbi:MAG: SMP-30/gluconolactonase/LRE family protein [Rhodospirillales bacterium]|nr:MAG: SMP-30/gluconolactonase/LRE family protein [Rhodospirillales bacterium]
MREVTTGYGLVEGPVWDPARGLYFSDVMNGGVFLLDRADKVSLAVPKRRGVGGIALHAAGGLVLGGRDVVHAPLDGGPGRTLLAAADTPGGIGFNDLTTDRAGRVYVGSLAFRVFGGEAPKPGHLHVIDLDGRARTISDGVMLTNGLGVSPDGTRLYHSDARAHIVRVYDVGADGSVGPWRVFADLGEDHVPDGLKVAADGSVWVADAHGGRVAVYGADGAHRMDLAVPLSMVTSVCFAGDDLRDLYVVTGSRGGPRENCGTVFRTRVDTPGLALAPARVALS